MKLFHAPCNISHKKLQQKRIDAHTSAYSLGWCKFRVLIQSWKDQYVLQFTSRYRTFWLRHSLACTYTNTFLLLLDSSTKPRPSTEIYFPGMKRSLRLRPQFLYETLSCILPTLSCLKDDPAWGWNMENKWKIQSRLTNCGWLLCQINRRQFCSTFQ